MRVRRTVQGYYGLTIVRISERHATVPIKLAATQNACTISETSVNSRTKQLTERFDLKFPVNDRRKRDLRQIRSPTLIKIFNTFDI